MTNRQQRAAKLHQNVPADWYVRSIRENVFQRYWHTRRFEEIRKLVPPTAGRILDIGSADGTFTKVILDASGAGKIVGIDALPKSVSWAKRRFARSKKMSFRTADAHKLPFADKSFAAVFCLETLEHVEDPEKVISEMYRVLKEDGYAVILVPSENFLFHFVVWPLWGLWRGRVWKGTHIQEIPVKELLRQISKAGFKVTEHSSFLFDMLHAVKVIKKN